MTKWRETGYVPPSDGEESDEEISTQEDTQPEDVLVSQPAPTENEEGEKTGYESDFMDIDQVLPRTQGALAGREKEPEVVDMSHLRDEEEDMDMDRDDGGVTLPVFSPSLYHRFPLTVEERPSRATKQAPKDPEQSETLRFSSPDPITGQPQPLSGLKPTLPRTPAPPASPTQRPASPTVSSASSPLSPVPSPPTSPTTTPRDEPRRLAGIEVVIPTNRAEEPTIRPTSPFYQRSLRQRKPIQLHPYLLEDARYKAHMKARGVKPVRIRFDEEERARANAAGETQDTEFAPPPVDDDESQERISRRHRLKEGEERPKVRRTSDPARLERPALHYGGSNKRRKTTHGEPERPGSRPRLSTPTRVNASRDAQTTGSDTFDVPESPSPNRTPLARPMQRLQNEQDPVLPSSGTIKRVGLLSLLNDSDDSDDESPLLPPVRRPASTVMSTPRRASSLPPERSSPVLPPAPRPEPIHVPDDDENKEEEAAGSEHEDGSDADSTATAKLADPVRSKLISHFRKKGTRGVLPASFIKLNKPRPPEEPQPEVHRPPRRPSMSASPERRPGVARTKVSAAVISRRISDLVSDQGESDSDSGNEPVFLSSAPALKRKQKETGRSLTQPSIIDMLGYESDIPEDNTFDHGGPGGTRIGTKRRPKKSGSSSAKRSGVGSGGRKQRSQATTGTRTKKNSKSTGPRVGIVDAYRHARETKTPMPDFARIAARSASKRPGKGRQSPSRKKVFVLDTAESTREVQEVLRDWRRDALPFRAPSPEVQRRDAYRSGPSGTSGAPVQATIPSPEHLAENAAKPRARKIPVVRRVANTTRPRQTSLHHHFPSDRSGNSARSKQRPAPKPLAVHKSGRPFLTHRPNVAPVPAQLERVVPSAQTRPPPLAQQRTSWRARLDDLADVIQTRAQLPPARTQSAFRTAESETTTDIGTPRGPARVPPAHLGRSRRKGIARHVDVDIIERRQPSPEVLAVDDDFSALPPPTQPYQAIRSANPQKPKLKGLLPWGQKYSLNFDIHPLRHGTILNSETLIGKGDLAKALQTAPARVGRAPDLATFTFGTTVLQWGAYEDNVASQFESVMNQIGDTCERFNEDSHEQPSELEMSQFVHQAYRFFDFVVRYIADTLTFHDPLDVVPFGQQFLQAVEQCTERVIVGTSTGGTALEKRPETRLALQTSGFALLVARQIKQLLDLETDTQEQLELSRVMGKLGRQLLSRLVRCRFGPIRDCYEDQRRRARFEQGIGTENYLVELWVLAIQTLDGERLGEVRFWDLLSEQLNARIIDTSLEVQTFEKLWKALFTMLPLFQFDNHGISVGITDPSLFKDNWSLVRMLIGRLLKIYNSNREGQSVNINTYIRLLYARCHHLMTHWSWSSPELVIPTLYEFFANSGLRMLKGEDHHGSPRFVDDLDKDPSLDPEDSDACFHLLLKIIAVGLKKMAMRNIKRKTIDNLIYRLMPNHRRQYPKDEDLSYRDLAILRNHHDLLVTLYWAAPPASRPPIDAIQLLINPENTHIKAVTVVVRAWSNLLRFQLHSGEGTEPLKPLMKWFDYLIVKLLGQHQAARSDAEKQLAAARANGELISDAHFEENVKQNQRRVEAVLVDIVHSLAREMGRISGDVEAGKALLSEDATATILRASTKLGWKVIVEVLGLIAQFIKTCREKKQVEIVEPVQTVQQGDEESQDYGDASIFEDLDFEMVEGMGAISEERKAAEHLLQHASHAVFQVLSNCFGADRQPEESLLATVVDVWCLLAEFLVKNGLKSWDAYLRHGNESWSSLRDTPQTRKFTSYFMPKVIESDPAVYASNKLDFLLFWIKGLVERESMLAFQAKYTATLLNMDARNPVLANMPFVRDVAGRVQISQHEFRARRLALISTLLENMRITYESSTGNAALDLKREYAELLREMMTTMKDNYQQLQSTTNSGAYITFIHAVISSLQQHTTDLVPIDKFFTESSAFPLPANDPNYVVGRLRKFATKLSQPHIQHQLNSFFQSQCERTALNGAHSALVQQITAAVVPELEEDGRVTLRAYLIHTLLPVYITLPFSSWTVGWVVTLPLLHATLGIVAPLEAAVDATSPASLAAARSLLDSLLDSIRQAISMAIDTPDTFTSAPHIAVLTVLLRIIAAATPALNRLCGPASRAVEAATFILRAAHYGTSALFPGQYSDVVRPLDIFDTVIPPPAPFAGGRRGAERSIVGAIQRQWGKSDGAFYFQRGVTRETVHAPSIPDLHTVAQEFGLAVREAVRVASRTEALGEVAQEVSGEVFEQESRGRPAQTGRTLDGLASVMM